MQKSSHGPFISLVTGALAGAAGAIAMTPLMTPRTTRTLPSRHRPRVFPPRRVMERAAEIGAGRSPRPRTAAAMAWPAHLGYGALTGATYAAIRPVSVSTPTATAAAGTAFGLVVWAVGYVGWLPLIGVREGTVAGPPPKMPLPLAAHAVFGITTALVHAALQPECRLQS